MSEENKAIYRDHFDVLWNARRGDQLERFIARDYKGFEVEEVIEGVEGYKQHFLTLTTASRTSRSRSTRSWLTRTSCRRAMWWRRPIAATSAASHPRETEWS